jgi:ribonuclease-3 family protein
MMSPLFLDLRVSDWSPLAMAYIGDAIWEVYARERTMQGDIRRPSKLHQQCTRYVCAAGQAAALRGIDSLLTNEERDIARRGRNSKSKSIRKNATVSDYRHGTGFEALIGYLAMTNQWERLHVLAGSALDWIDQLNEGGALHGEKK